jgi:O-acetyl-ADP-ribose deacetylase (regulator of RNase III)
MNITHKFLSVLQESKMIILKSYVNDIVAEYHNGAIVNAAKSTLMGGSGVDGAIHRAAGPRLLDACKNMHVFQTIDTGAHGNLLIRCPVGKAVITYGFDLKVPYIIHTVGPIYKDDTKLAPKDLMSCYYSCMHIALSQGLPEISFPAIGTGIFGYPLEEAAIIAVNSVLISLKGKPEMIVNFVCYDEVSFLVYKRVIEAAKSHWCVAEVF